MNACTVGELVAWLKEFPEDCPVVVINQHDYVLGELDLSDKPEEANYDGESIAITINQVIYD